MKYTNTRPIPLRLITSKGIRTLDGMSSMEIDEVLNVPDFVTVEGAPEPVVEVVEEPVVEVVEEPVVEAVEEPVTTTEKPKRRRRRTKKTED